MTDRRDEGRVRDEHAAGDLRVVAQDERAALEEIAALRAVLVGLGVTGLQPGVDPDDDDAEVEAAIARIVALDGARADADVDHGTDDEDGVASGVVDLASRRHRRARHGWTATAGAAAVVLVAVGATMLAGRTAPPAVATGSPPMLAYPLEPGDLVASEGASAADTLLELADVAAARRDPEPVGDVQYALSQSWLFSVTGTSVLFEPVVVESWLAADGSSVAAEWRGGALGDDGQLLPVDTSPPPTSVDRLPAGAFDPDLVADLSLDPAILREQLLVSPASPPECRNDPTISSWCLYLAVTDLSDRYVVSSAVESAFWAVLAGEPGLTLAGEVADRLGRRSVAIAVPGAPYDVDPTVRVLLVDSATGRLSGREVVTLFSEALDVTEPTVTEFHYNVTNTWVARVGGPSTGA